MIKWKSIEIGEKRVRAEKTKYWDKMKQLGMTIYTSVNLKYQKNSVRS